MKLGHYRKVGRACSIASFHLWNDVKTSELFCGSGYLAGKGDSGPIPFQGSPVK
jgi:hypothetical protein